MAKIKTMKPIFLSMFDINTILNGRKTQTRRVIKPQPIPAVVYGENCLSWSHEQHYKSGDILWVKETWAKISDWVDVDPKVGLFDGYIYKAEWDGDEHPRWHPSIYMPKEAARIFLKVKNIEIERLQSISGFDCVCEGISILDILENTPGKDFEEYARLQFSEIWDKKNTNKGYFWGSNPWVWKIEFERMEKSCKI